MQNEGEGRSSRRTSNFCTCRNVRICDDNRGSRVGKKNCRGVGGEENLVNTKLVSSLQVQFLVEHAARIESEKGGKAEEGEYLSQKE